ncbi:MULTISPECIES: TIGR03086 family metal-binding protein [unclassified Streptomyces]|uniref:TIGR03086 family metal-binding protein n=1 Tax=unclassified Streptomyces TaxID=2593676 RepID=UPI002E810BD8|nr:TIGR03086 family metal-binding protein [Streptomyces sp. NBC_00589]WTI34166.1 TIGR03086 family metal-binding protein [Streptomyces sp. NBC_00775]WUB32162.1 TIGR03086 family metal-binding protein [Streptomyces sp. NBC_00589]
MSKVEGVELLRRAHTCLREVVAAVPEGAWGSPTPCSEWTVRQVLNHARLDQQAYGAAITGAGWPDSDPFHPADALDADARAALAKVLRDVADTYAQLPARAEEVATPLGPLPLRLAAAAGAMDAAVHAWDIAVATGQDAPLDEELAEGIWAAAERLADHLRDSFGVFAAAREVSEGQSRAEALLAFLGRDPHWTPAAS